MPTFHIVLHCLYKRQSEDVLKAEIFKYDGCDFNEVWQVYLMDSYILAVMAIKCADLRNLVIGDGQHFIILG